MKKQPSKENYKLFWMACLIVAVGITAARVICHYVGVPWSDSLTRVLGGAEIVAVAAMVFFYMRWRQAK